MGAKQFNYKCASFSSDIKTGALLINSVCILTLKVQVFGSCGRLRSDFGINLDCMEIIGVPGDDDVVPLVVTERFI